MKNLFFIYEETVIDHKKQRPPNYVVFVSDDYDFKGFCVDQFYKKIRNYKYEHRRKIEPYLPDPICNDYWACIETCNGCTMTGFPCHSCKCYFMNGGIKYENLRVVERGSHSLHEMYGVDSKLLDCHEKYTWVLVDNTIMCGHSKDVCIAIF